MEVLSDTFITNEASRKLLYMKLAVVQFVTSTLPILASCNLGRNGFLSPGSAVVESVALHCLITQVASYTTQGAG